MIGAVINDIDDHFIFINIIHCLVFICDMTNRFTDTQNTLVRKLDKFPPQKNAIPIILLSDGPPALERNRESSCEINLGISRGLTITYVSNCGLSSGHSTMVIKERSLDLVKLKSFVLPDDVALDSKSQIQGNF